MILFFAGIVIAAAAGLMALWFLAAFYSSRRVRLAHGIPNPPFFQAGSGLVFGMLVILLLIGVGLVWLSH